MKLLKLAVSALLASSVLACGHNPSKESAAETSKQVAIEKSVAEFKDGLAKTKQQPIFKICDVMQSAVKKVKANQSSPTTTERLLVNLSTMPSLLYEGRIPEFEEFGVWSIRAGETYEKSAEYQSELIKLHTGLLRELPFAQRLDTHGYYATMLTRLSFANLKFADSPEIKNFCAYLETPPETTTDAELAKRFSKLLKSAKVSAKKIEFDPQWKSQIEIRNSGRMVNYYNTVFDQFRPAEKIE